MGDYQFHQYLASKGIYYMHSGKTTPLGIILIPLFGILGAAFFSIIYAYATVYIPFVYLNCLITMGYGFIIGKLIIIGAEKGKIRNLKLVLFLAILVAIFAEYFNWLSWIFAYSKGELFVMSPLEIISILKVIAVFGAWSIKSFVVKGITLYLVWVAEAAIIMGVIIYYPYATIKSMPFCEKCNIWIKNKIMISMLEPIIDVESFKSQLERRDYGNLLKLKMVDRNSSAYTVIELLSCPSCRQQYILNVKSMKVITNSKGKKSSNSKTIIENLIINEDTYSLIRGLNKI